MSTAVPDAWDECAACGHDRDDHAGNGPCSHTVRGPAVTDTAWILCTCPAFMETA